MGSWFFSDKIALAAARAKPVSEEEDPRLYQMVRDLTTRAGLPMPKLYVIPQEQPNAFATGRNPKHSAVAVTAGIRKLLTRGRAARRARARARPRPQPRHPADLGGRDDRVRHHLDRLHGALDRRRRQLAARGSSARCCSGCSPRSPRRSSRWRSRASASTRPTPQARRSAGTRSRSPPRCCASSPAPRRSRCRSTRRPSRSTSSSRSSGGGLASLFSTHPPIEERVRRLRQMRPTIG